MLEPLVAVFPVRFPLVAAHVTLNAAVAVAPAVTVTVCGFAPSAAQLAASPEIPTLWLPAASALNVTLPLTATAWPVPPSTATRKPSGSMSEPDVVVVAVRSPVVTPDVAVFNASVLTSHVSWAPKNHPHCGSTEPALDCTAKAADCLIEPSDPVWPVLVKPWGPSRPHRPDIVTV